MTMICRKFGFHHARWHVCITGVVQVLLRFVESCVKL